MTLIVPTAYRRNGLREQYSKLGDATEAQLKCLRCFRPATIGLRCDACRAKREADNKTRKR